MKPEEAVYEKKAERLAAELTDCYALIKDHLAKIMHLENRVEAEAHRAEVERLREALTAAQVRANEYAAEVERLREALSGLLESPASFEDSRLDYAERQVDTKAWDEAKAALATLAEEPKP